MRRASLLSGLPARVQRTFAYEYRGMKGTLQAPTRSEARAELKKRLGFKTLPAGTILRELKAGE